MLAGNYTYFPRIGTGTRMPGICARTDSDGAHGEGLLVDGVVAAFACYRVLARTVRGKFKYLYSITYVVINLSTASRSIFPAATQSGG